jgi:hypothetical protein
MVYSECHSGLHLVMRSSQFTTINWNFFPTLLSWHEYDSGVWNRCSTNRRKKPTSAVQYCKLSGPSVSCKLVWILFDVDAVGYGENSFICLYHSPLFVLWNSVIFPIYVFQTGTKYWPKVLPCCQINILIDLVCDAYYYDKL